MFKDTFVYDPNWAKTAFDVADGDHRVWIVSVKDEISKQGKAMVHIQYKVEGASEPYDDFLVEGDYFNKSASRIFDVFKIVHGDWNYQHWINRVAYAHFEHVNETYTDNYGQQKTVKKSKLRYFHNNVPPAQTAPAQPPQQQAQPANNLYQEDIPF
ncbi:hypothetical protein [uncultured Treponema sp.]|uniref:hypothetical protein n=1 Tax=uncultured Treponema sp. TaxID=162155 RepID=UPI00260FC9E0|nr:hypothetical protein [uncultured Treponema sp.]